MKEFLRGVPGDLWDGFCLMINVLFCTLIVWGSFVLVMASLLSFVLPLAGVGVSWGFATIVGRLCLFLLVIATVRFAWRAPTLTRRLDTTYGGYDWFWSK